MLMKQRKSIYSRRVERTDPRGAVGGDDIAAQEHFVSRE